MALLALNQVTKTYPGRPPVAALQQVSLEIEAGEFVAVVGPSGSGKTTLLSIMGTLEQPSSGQVWIDGLDIAELNNAEVSRLRADVMGFVFQQFFLLPSITALDNVATGMLYQGFPRAVRRQRGWAALEQVGLADRAGHRPGELSGGEQQRTAIARAIAGQPAILFADEPTGALDQTTGRQIITTLAEIADAGTAVVCITHNPALADRFGRQIAILDGQVVADRRRPWTV